MGKKNYDALAEDLIRNIGGMENITGLYHCVTRLRFQLKDDHLANTEAIRTCKGVLSVVSGQGQYQVVIGNEVTDVYDAILRLYPIKNAKQAESDDGQKTGNWLARMLNSVSSIMNPIVTALAGAGMLKALLVILTTTLGWLDKTSATYAILSAAGNSVFYFLPLFLAISSAKTFRANPYIALAIVGALLEPSFVKLMHAPGDVVRFMGVPVVLMQYAGTLVPAVVSIWLYAKLEVQLKRIIPKSIDIFAASMIALLIMVPAAVIVIGPIGVAAANAVGGAVNLLSERAGGLTGAIIGGGWTFLVMLGIHWGVVPIMVNNVSSLGYDVIRPMVAAATFASAGAAFGAFLKLRKKEDRAFALSTLAPALLGGVTEPIIYGISLNYKRILIAQAFGGAAAGMFMGAMKTKAFVYVFPAITTLPAFIGDTFVYYLFGITIAFSVTALCTYAFGIPAPAAEAKAEANADGGRKAGALSLNACVRGRQIELTQVKDAVFSQKLLGDGTAFVPAEGTLYAPAAGVVETVFPTGHAVGLRTPEGVEILLHIGVDTVALEGKGFRALVQQGDTAAAGQKLVKFDMECIEAEGYDLTTMMCVSNTDAIADMRVLFPDRVTEHSKVIELTMKEAAR